MQSKLHKGNNDSFNFWTMLWTSSKDFPSCNKFFFGVKHQLNAKVGTAKTIKEVLRFDVFIFIFFYD